MWHCSRCRSLTINCFIICVYIILCLHMFVSSLSYIRSPVPHIYVCVMFSQYRAFFLFLCRLSSPNLRVFSFLIFVLCFIFLFVSWPGMYSLSVSCPEQIFLFYFCTVTGIPHTSARLPHGALCKSMLGYASG